MKWSSSRGLWNLDSRYPLRLFVCSCERALNVILHWTLVACDCWKNGEPLVNMGPKTVFQLCCYGVQSGVYVCVLAGYDGEWGGGVP